MDESSEYDPTVDYGRLKLSSDFHLRQDQRNLDRVVEHLESNGVEPPFSVLDAGCGYGIVTEDRFGDDDHFEVLGIDREPGVIDLARQRNSADNISYEHRDVTDIDGLGEFDIVFSTYLFHHLDEPEAVLELLWDATAEPGALFVRSCDDGQHLHYPPDEDVEFIVQETATIPGSSNRTHGRQLYTDMSRLEPAPTNVSLDIENYHTADYEGEDQERFFEVFHSNRLHYAQVRASRADSSDEAVEFYEEMRERMERVREKFRTEDGFLDVKSVPLAVAFK